MQKPTGDHPNRVEILSPTDQNIQIVAQALKENEVVGLPTETVYGLAGNAFSNVALARIFETKERPTFDPLIIHVGIDHHDLHALEKSKLIEITRLSERIQHQIQILIHQFWPGPLTLVLPKHPNVPDLATSGMPTVALRMPNHPIALKLISAAGFPLAAPSANRFGRISPTSPQAVAEELGTRIPWILDGGTCSIGVESTILGLNESQDWVVFRPGGTPVESIERALGIQLPYPSTGQPNAPKILAPGMLESHYAPRKPVKLLYQPIQDLTPENKKEMIQYLQQFDQSQPIGILLMSDDSRAEAKNLAKIIDRPVIIRSLSANGDLCESARNLFSELRYLDSTNAEVIFVEFCFSNQGLGYAISDRLRRASAPRGKA